jgi:hypothetical protein
MAVKTRKFSQFVVGGPLQQGDLVAGLRNGMNTIFDAGGGIGGGGVIILVTQPGHGLVKENWVRIDGTGNFVKGLADNAENAEIQGLVIDVPTINTFMLQVVGLVQPGVFSGLDVSGVYFLSDVTAGLMVRAEPTISGHVRLPMFTAWTSDSGFIRQFTGLVLGAFPPVTAASSGAGSNVFTFTQAGHTFGPGNWIRVVADATYGLAQADTFDNSQATAVVISVSGNDFNAQTEGRNIGAVTVDDTGAALLPGIVYYLSETVAGFLTPNKPVIKGKISKPCYVRETVAINSGTIIPQRPLVVGEGGGGPIVDEIEFINCSDPETIVLAAGVWTAIPCLEAKVSPSSLASEMIIEGVFNGDRAVNTVAPVCIRLLRNGTPIALGAGPGVACWGRLWTTVFIESFLHVDTPNTLADVTYTFEAFCASNNTIYLNTDVATGFNGSSTLMVTEYI